jgi:hypothetical protein
MTSESIAFAPGFQKHRDLSYPTTANAPVVVEVVFEGQLAEFDTHIEKLFSHMEHPIKTIGASTTE